MSRPLPWSVVESRGRCSQWGVKTCLGEDSAESTTDASGQKHRDFSKRCLHLGARKKFLEGVAFLLGQDV